MEQIARRPGRNALGQKTGTAVTATVLLTGVRRVVAAWSMRRRSRADLARLTPAQLRDIGLDRLSAEDEAQRPFWQP